MHEVLEKLDEVISLIRALDTKIMFLEEDIQNIKITQEMQQALILEMSTASAQQAAQQGKEARMQAFKEASARW
jgi:hypothetical protein